MAIFNSYVSLPEGNYWDSYETLQRIGLSWDFAHLQNGDGSKNWQPLVFSSHLIAIGDHFISMIEK